MNDQIIKLVLALISTLVLYIVNIAIPGALSLMTFLFIFYLYLDNVEKD